MSILNWFVENNVDRENKIVVKSAKSKCPHSTPCLVDITVGDIKRGKVTDMFGDTSEVVLFLRKGKN